MLNISLQIVLITYLLEEVFMVGDERVASVAGNIGMVSEIGGLVAEITLGYLQDLFGRKWINIGGLLSASVAVVCMPLPHRIFALYFLRALTNAGFIPVNYTPFTLDYVAKDSLSLQAGIGSVVKTSAAMLSESGAVLLQSHVPI